MIELNDEQRQELSQPEPSVVDPVFLEGEDARLMYRLLADVDSEDWEDASSYESRS